MAGKRQHYVPRLLQRGFLHDPTEEAERTWLHRRGVEPRLVGIRDVGVEDYFYSRPSVDGSPTLDEFITALEGDLGGDISQMRSTEVGESVDANLAASLVVHLVTRTAQIRSFINRMLVDIADEVTNRFAEPGYLHALMGLDQVNPSVRFSQALSELLDEAPLEQLGMPRPLAERICCFIARERADSMVVPQTELAPTITGLIKNASEQFRDAHNKAIMLSLDDNVWVNELSEYEWRIESSTDGAILSDCVAVILENGAGFVPFMLADQKSARAVILPLNSDRLLVGRKRTNVEIDFAGYNAVAAACSEAFFIKARKVDKEGLVDLIGSRPSQAIDRLVDKAFADLESQTADHSVRGSVEHDPQSPLHSQNFSYRVCFADFGDTALATEVSEVVAEIVKELSRNFSLDNLDGFTFAVDYPTALRNLDRGSTELPPAETRALGYGHGVAKAVSVVRDGRQKSHLVVQADIALGLLSTDAKQRRASIGMHIRMLACVAHAAIYAPVLDQHGPPDAMSWYLHEAIAQVPCLYFAAKTSAVADVDAAEAYTQLVIDGLACMKAEILKERLLYRTSGDLGRLLAVAVPLVSGFLEHASEWLGHRDGLAEGIEFPGSDLPRRLRQEGLEAWLELFGRDLRAIYDGPKGRLDLERIHALDRHVERLLWIFQICPWPTLEGNVYFSVPYGNDIALLSSDRRED